MAIVKSAAQIRTQAGDVLGIGMAYIHLPKGVEQSQRASGTVSLQQWDPSAGEPVELALTDGRRLNLSVSRDALSDCSRNRILRFTTQWPPNRDESA